MWATLQHSETNSDTPSTLQLSKGWGQCQQAWKKRTYIKRLKGKQTKSIKRISVDDTHWTAPLLGSALRYQMQCLLEPRLPQTGEMGCTNVKYRWNRVAIKASATGQSHHTVNVCRWLIYQSAVVEGWKPEHVYITSALFKCRFSFMLVHNLH